MANEGTYPYVGGGVSTWCHILCENLTEIDWHIFAVVAEPFVSDNYETHKLPQIKEKIIVPLWGFEELSEYIDDRPFKEIYKAKRETTSKIITEKFIPSFKVFLDSLESDSLEMAPAGVALHKMYLFFRKYDYSITMKSKEAWDCFRDFSINVCTTDPLLKLEPPHLFEITTCMRWFYNMFLPIAAFVPETTVTHATITASTAIACIVSKFEYNSPMLVTDHGVYARERYIACSSAPFGLYGRRFLARLALIYSRLCYYYADVIAPCAHFNARWKLPLGGVTDRPRPIDFKTWKGTGVVPNLEQFPFIRPIYDALNDLKMTENYSEETEYPWIRTIYNGVDTDRFNLGEKPEKYQGIPTCVALARVFPLKDVLTMIESCAVAKKDIPNVLYIVYGSLNADPPYVAECHALIKKLELEDNFNLAGFHSKPNEAFWEGDISVLSSISEGFPFTVLESMAAGVPVVGTDVGGCKEAIGIGADACGIVVPPRDPEAFGKAVVQLLSDNRLRMELARKGRERVLRLFQTSTSVDAYYELYKKLGKMKLDGEY